MSLQRKSFFIRTVGHVSRTRNAKQCATLFERDRVASRLCRGRVASGVQAPTMESSPLLSKGDEEPITPAPAVARVKESWGTRKRLEVTLKHVDQAGVDEMIDRAMRMGNAPKFIAQYHPQAQWLWRQWNGTVLQATWSPAVLMMMFSMALVLYMELTRRTGSHRWSILEVPDPKDAWVARLMGVTTMWGYLLTMATFVNSFFLSQACAPAPAARETRRKEAGARTHPRLRPAPRTARTCVPRRRRRWLLACHQG